ncbi:MAG: cytochrome b/b6 domain-containing protein [Acetobacteraceae bacterium]
MNKRFESDSPAPGVAPGQIMRRHALPVRVTHWIHFASLVILLMSGLAIFNGWPALYWGIATRFVHPLLAMFAMRLPDGREVGMTWVLGHQFVTTGWFGLFPASGGQAVARGFPAWATLPGPLDLARARRWHFFFAWIFVINGAVYALYAVGSGHLRRDLIPSGREFREIGASIRDHALLRFPKGSAARKYNVLQKLSYLIVMFGMAPLMVASGLSMSPWIDAGFPWLVEIFGGRQSARTIHFIVAFLLLAFVLIHVLMVLASGVFNNLRGMITGRYRIATLTEERSRERDEPTRSD